MKNKKSLSDFADAVFYIRNENNQNRPHDLLRQAYELKGSSLMDRRHKRINEIWDSEPPRGVVILEFSNNVSSKHAETNTAAMISALGIQKQEQKKQFNWCNPC